MEIILKQDVDNVGHKDSVVKVRDGYARNFLFPRGLAILATSSSLRHHEEITRQKSHKETRLRNDAAKTAEILNAITIQVGAKVSQTGKIFGSVTALQLAEELQKRGYNISRKQITLDEESIKETGKYSAKIKLHKDIAATFNFEVVKE
ncbi:MAG: 50S ribosomal protein L9 [Bacteroidetes bacterium]|nr:50S ribosomal protein L9 [Bacteroidota bacterium]